MMTRFFCIVLLCYIFNPITIFSQIPCGTDAIHKHWLDTDPDYTKRQAVKERNIQNIISSAKDRSASGIDTIPVVVHVLHTGQAIGTGYNISDAQIQSSIDRVNAVFADYDDNGTDTNIRFALAVRDPTTCTSSSGINRIDATGTNNYENEGISTDETRLDLFNLSRWNTEEYLNFWVVSEINDNNGDIGTQGYATYSTTSHQYDGVVCMYNTTGYDPTGALGYNVKSTADQNETVIHEFGHYLDVFHTFEGDDEGTTCPADTDCTTDGDRCCDTDPHQRTSSNFCWENLNNSCTSSNYGEVVNNYMAYSSQDCKDRFSADQVARMQAILLSGRTGLLTSPGLTPVTASEPSAACALSTTNTATAGSYGVGIIKIEMGNWISESGGTYSEGGYIDNWCDQNDLERNTTYNYTITLSGNNPEYIRVWIDYNDDGAFNTSDELIISSGSRVTSLSGTFTTPSSPTTDTPLRIRFRSSQNSSTNSCYDDAYGQAEDYAVYFENTSVLDVSVAQLTDLHKLDCCTAISQTFTMSGTDLSNNVNLTTAGNDYELSSDGTNFSNSLTLTNDNGDIQNEPVTIYLRLKDALVVNSYNDNLTISSSPAPDVVIPISGAVVEIDGIRGNKLTTDGTGDYAIANNFKGITGGDSRTYEAWIRTTSSTSSTAAFISNGTKSSGEKWTIRLDDSRLRLEVNGGHIRGTSIIDDEEWHHIVVVFNNTSGTLADALLYVDGNNESFTSSSGSTLTINTANNQNLWIGTDHSNREFAGDIDEIRVWSVARTESEIRETMHLTLNGQETGLEAYYQFNEASGMAAVDKVNGHNLSLVGNTAFAASTIDVATGVCSSVAVGSTGTSGVEVSANDLEIDFADGSTAPDGDLIIYKLEGQPANSPGENFEASFHWVVRNFGNNQSGLDVESIMMTLPTSDPLLAYNESTMSLYKRNSNSDGNWTTMSAAASSSDQTTGEIVFGGLSGFTSFSQISMGSDGLALPVNWQSFSAKRLNQSAVLLEWATVVEAKNTGFEIQQSYDGQRYETIGFKKGQGTTNSFNNYQYSVLELKSAYYRLKQIDEDKSVNYSNVRYVEGSEKPDGFTFFPNPSHGTLQVTRTAYFPAEILTFSIISTQGKTMLNMQGNLEQINQMLSQEISKFPNGIYFIEIGNGLQPYVERLVISGK